MHKESRQTLYDSARTLSANLSFHRVLNLPWFPQLIVEVEQEVEHRSPDSFGVTS